MRFISRSAFLALVAVCALSAVGLASASAALPAFGPSTFIPAKFSGTAKGTIKFEETAGKYSCSGVSSISGSIASSTSLTGVVIKFDCESGSSIICQRPLKILETRELKGRLGYVTKPTKVGLLLEPVAEPIASCTAFDGVPAEIKGSLLGEITPVNSLTKTFTLHYTESGGTQTLRHFEGEEVLHNLTKLLAGESKASNFGYEGTLTFTTEHDMELKA
jgi:hypothetical protein